LFTSSHSSHLFVSC